LFQTLKDSLSPRGIKLVTGIRQNMKPQLMSL